MSVPGSSQKPDVMRQCRGRHIDPLLDRPDTQSRIAGPDQRQHNLQPRLGPDRGKPLRGFLDLEPGGNADVSVIVLHKTI